MTFHAIYMKCQILFFRSNKKIIISLLSAEFAHSMVSVNILTLKTPITKATDNILKYFVLFSEKIKPDISCESSASR